jgi:pimeloyl-ACP methyl ester carboxylesterase
MTLVRNGRTVAVHDLTPDAPAGAPVVLLCHAAPGSGAFDPDPAATAAHGVRLLSLDRPGYGASDPVGDAFATVGDAADDAAALLAEVLPDGATAGVAGWSAGGRVALALAARHPGLVGRVAAIGTPAPDEEVPWYGDENRAMVEALRGLPPRAATAALTAALATLPVDPDGLLALAGVADADAAVLTPPVRDLVGYTLADWGFTPPQVAADVLLAYGADDERVPPAHGEWYRDRLPSAELQVWPGVGHLVVVPAWGRVLEHLRGAGAG